MLYRFLDFEIDPLRFRLSRGGTPVHLPRQIFDLILFLVRHRDRPVAKQEILEAVWHGRSVTIASLSHAIADARKLLGDTPASQSIIKTVHGRGYWWVVETEETRPKANPGDRLPFVGRTEELAILGRALDDAYQRRGSLILLIGEAGIGKSRLIEEFAERSENKGFSVFFSHCLENEGAPPGWPWIQLVGAVLERLGTPRHPSVSDAAGHLEAVFPELQSGRGSEVERLSVNRPAERFMVVDSIWRVLAASSSPIALVVDDLHRADSLSLWLMRLLARRTAHYPLLILGGSRESSSQVAELAGEPRTRTIELKGLGKSEVAGLVSQLGLHPVGEVSNALYERSSGNPFFIDQLISNLRGYEAPGWREVLDDSSRLPSSLRESILNQLRQLDEPSRTLLEVASAIGRSFAPPFLALAAGVPIACVLEAVDAAERIGLMEADRSSPGVMRFRHILVRDAVYSSLPRTRRCEIHRSIARAFAVASLPGEHLESKAHHLRSAFPLVPADEVAGGCLDAARAAASRLAYDEAAAHCDSGLQLVDEGNEIRAKLQCDLLVVSATARLRAGHRAEGRAHLRRAAMLARSEGLAGQLAEAALAIAPGFFAIETGVVDRQLIEALDVALGELPQADFSVRARLLGQLATALYWSADRERVEGLVEEASSTAARVAGRAAHAYALAARFVALWSPESLSERLGRATELVDSADATDDDDLRLMVRVFRIATFIEAGDGGAARRETGAFEQLVETTRHPHAQWYPPMYAAMWEITKGRFAAAEPLMARFLELGRRFEDANVIQTVLLQGAEINWQLGRASSIIAAVEENVASNPALREWECALAFLMAKAGRKGEARRLLERIVSDGLARVLGRMNAPIAMAALAECCWLLDADDVANAIQPVVCDWSDRMIVAGYGVLCWGSLARTKGHLAFLRGDWEEAEGCYMNAIEAETSMDAFAWLARTELALACLLRRRGRASDLERARRFGGRAKERADRLGMAALASEVDSLGQRRRV